VKAVAGRYSGLLLLPAGAMAVAAFAPFGWYPLAILSLAVLFSQWLDDSPGQALWHGALFGAGFFGAGVSWVYVSIHYFGHVHGVIAALLTTALIAFLALYPALLGYLLRRFRLGHSLCNMALTFPAGWVLAEWLRGRLLTGFPWLEIGTSQVDSPLAGYAPVLGAGGVGWTVALSAALLVVLLRGRTRLPALLALLVMWAGGYALNTIEWTGPQAGPLTVTIIQGNIPQEDKWAPENLQHTLTRYTELTMASPDSDLVVWPETAIPSFYHEVKDNYLDFLEAELRASDTILLSGIPVLDRESWQYFNGVLTLGAERNFYYKQHLVPFGEYLPLRGLLGNTLDALAVPNADFSAGGERQTLLQAAGYPAGTSICFEVAFGEEIRRALPQAAMLVNVSNDAWFGDSLAPHQHLEMARMRAKETGRPMLRATNTGISAIIAPDGAITARTPQFEEATLSGSIIPRQGATPYVLMGSAPTVILAVLCLLWSFVAPGLPCGSPRRAL